MKSIMNNSNMIYTIMKINNESMKIIKSEIKNND